MDHLHKLKRQITQYSFLLIVLSFSTIIVLGWLANIFLGIDPSIIAVASLVVGGLTSFALATLVTNYATEPVDFLWRAILHVAPSHTGTTAPNLDQSRVGHELVTSLALQVYQLASSTNTSLNKAAPASATIADSLSRNLPLPLFAIDHNQNISFANEAALQYLGMPASNVIGKNLYGTLDMSFPSSNTLDSWLQDCRTNKVTASNSWQRVRLKLADQKTVRQFDMAAYYNKDNPSGVETAVAIFDQTSRYRADDQALSFIALAVHELRTPLTMLRGYVEVFEDELSGQLTPDMADFMHKMTVSAQQLTSFVNNILNVARVEENQLVLQLTEADWSSTLQNAINDLSLRAQVHGITIDCSVDANLPTVGIDRVSIYEVINNLVDNAIKYSGKGKKIVVHSAVNREGLVETTIQDFGVGIPSSVMPHLFEKFERNHRNRAQIGGTGLGLYLSKAIVTAHGGNIWVQSKEDEGSIFGFTLLPYSRLAEELKNSDNKDIVRGAHGWIKNHSLYRR